MMRPSTISLILVLVAVPACSGEVFIPGENTGATSGATGSGGGSSGGVTTTSGGSVVSVGVGGSATSSGVGGVGVSASSSGVGGSSVSATSSGVGGSGGAPACGAETHDTLQIAFGSFQGDYFACNGNSGTFDFSARVVSSDQQGHFVLDSCSPAADCIELLSKLSVTAPNLSTDLPPETFVRVRGVIQSGLGGCFQQIQITNLPKWAGVPNPVQSGDVLWLQGMDGGLGPGFEDSPITIQPIPLGCFPGSPPGCGPREDYAFQVETALDPAQPGVVVPMGQTRYWSGSGPNGFQVLAVRNLRSYSLGICDGPSDFAYVVTHPPELD